MLLLQAVKLSPPVTAKHSDNTVDLIDHGAKCAYLKKVANSGVKRSKRCSSVAVGQGCSVSVY